MVKKLAETLHRVMEQMKIQVLSFQPSVKVTKGNSESHMLCEIRARRKAQVAHAQWSVGWWMSVT